MRWVALDGGNRQTNVASNADKPSQDAHSDNLTKQRAHRGGKTTAHPREESQQLFLDTLRVTGNVSVACKAAEISRETAYAWRDADDGFRDEWYAALASATQVLEGEAFRRAVVGYEKPVYQEGQLVGTVTVYSDALLQLLLKAAAPAKYRERAQVEHGGELTLKVVRVNDWRGKRTDAMEAGADGE